MENYNIFLIFCITLFTESFFPNMKKKSSSRIRHHLMAILEVRQLVLLEYCFSWSQHKAFWRLGCKQTEKQDTAWTPRVSTFQYQNMNQHRDFSTPEYHKKHANLNEVGKRIAVRSQNTHQLFLQRSKTYKKQPVSWRSRVMFESLLRKKRSFWPMSPSTHVSRIRTAKYQS